jgi:hypothetical protein
MTASAAINSMQMMIRRTMRSAPQIELAPQSFGD